MTPPPRGTVRAWLDKRATETPDAISHIFADGGGSLTWAALRAEAATIAGRLAGLGAVCGESVALCLPNGRAGVVCLFGALYGGFRATPLNLAAGPAAMGYAIGHSEARFAFVAPAVRDLFAAALAETDAAPEIIEAGESIAWPRAARAVSPGDVAESDHALLMYTSGTTGRPKGVVHDQSSLLAGGWTVAVAHELTADDRALMVLPFFHINGLCVTLMGPLVSGGAVIVAEKFSATRFWGWCAAHGATWFSVVPTIISHLLHGDVAPADDVIARLRFARSASAPLPVETQRAFEQRFRLPVVETMGLTETAAQMLSNPLPPGVRKIGSPGVAVGNETEILLDGVAAPRGTPGEIAVRGPNVMREYLRDPEETAKTILPDGWLLTGDLGHMDEDGYVFVTGRRKELIIKGGENIAPREIDEALYAHPAVIEAAAFAVPCARYGQRVEAAVKLAHDLPEAALIAFCAAKLGAFKTPDRVHVIDDLPKGPSGKIQRLRLAERFGGETTR